MRAAFAAGCLSVVEYLAFAGSLSRGELVTAGMLGLLCACWTIALRSASNVAFSFSRSHASVWLRAVGSVPKATLWTAVALAKAIFLDDATVSQSSKRPFRFGRIDDPADRARRATALLAASLAPASFVIRAEADGQVALIHEFSSAPAGHDPEWLA